MEFVYTVCAHQAEANHLAKQAVSQRLAACVNSWPVRSTYRWQGKVKTAREVVVLFKTDRAKLRALTAFLKKSHSYDMPAIIHWSATSHHAAYSRWLKKSL